MDRNYVLGRFQLGVFRRPGPVKARFRQYDFPEARVFSLTLPFAWLVFRWSHV